MHCHILLERDTKDVFKNYINITPGNIFYKHKC